MHAQEAQGCRSDAEDTEKKKSSFISFITASLSLTRKKQVVVVVKVTERRCQPQGVCVCVLNRKKTCQSSVNTHQSVFPLAVLSGAF